MRLLNIRYVVDLDLEKFFDRVNHDRLMMKISEKVKDKKVLLLIRKYLQSGEMQPLRENEKGRRTSKGIRNPIHRNKAETEGKPREKCGRPTLETEVPWF